MLLVTRSAALILTQTDLEPKFGRLAAATQLEFGIGSEKLQSKLRAQNKTAGLGKFVQKVRIKLEREISMIASARIEITSCNNIGSFIIKFLNSNQTFMCE